MIGRKTRGFDSEVYKDLLVRFHPQPIHDEADLRAAEEVIEELLAAKQLTQEQEAVLELVTGLVEAWERDSVHIPAAEPREVIRFLLEQGDHRQKDLIPVFGTESIVSEVLAGKRDLQRKHIAGLASFFRVSPAVFFGDLNAEPLERVAVGSSDR